MSGICENGHRSSTDDYCDTCGAPVSPAPSVTIPPPAASPMTQKCPNCAATNPIDALFCEACGYDYTTGTLPRSDAAGMLGLRRNPTPASTAPDNIPVAITPVAGPAISATPSYPGSKPVDQTATASDSVPNGPASAPTPEPVVETATEPVVAETFSAEPAVVEPVAAEPAQAPIVQAPTELSGDQSVPQPSALLPQAEATAPLDDEPPTRGRPAPRPESYVAEVWIDPDWYEVQETDEPMPSVALPATIALGADNLIGRASASRNIHPEVDCGIDSGVSRRQARLSTDNTRWYVEDLSSANGTFVGPASGPLPTTPIQGRYELGPDDRVYVGAWTRIVVRKASKDEIDSLL